MTPPDKKIDKAEIYEKIKQLYHNYGIDTANMNDEEFDRLIESYSSRSEDLDADLLKSERYSEKFSEDLI